MKRLIALLILIFAVGILSAQKPSLTRAYNLYYEKDFVKAKEVIDLCTADEKLKLKAQTWLYKGNIYFYLGNKEYNEKQENESYQIQFPDAPVEAYDAFVKAKEINKNVEGYEMLSPDDALSKMHTLLLIVGVNKLISNDLEGAKLVLDKAIKCYEMDNATRNLNGELYYYYAYTLETLKLTDAVRNYYEKAIQDGYKKSNVYIRMIDYYKQEDNKAKVLEYINLAKSFEPNNPNILVAEIDYYYWIDEKEKGQKLLSNIPSSLYSDADAMVNLSNFYIKDKNYLQAEDLLKKANQLNPNNYIVLYNLGVCSYYLLEEYFLNANELEVSGNKSEAMAVKTKANNYLEQAELYFEQALTFYPDDLNILNALKSIYARKQSPKYDEITKKINSLNK